MSLNEALTQPDLPMGDAETLEGRYVWDEYDPPIVIHVFKDGRIFVNGEEVLGRPEFDGQQPPQLHEGLITEGQNSSTA